MKKQLHTAFLVVGLLSCNIYTRAQVTIGSGIPPRDGVLLDLKENKEPHTNPNTNKGLGLPRVKLVAADKFLDSETDPDKIEELEGVMVYNVDKDVLEGAGVYTWSGEKWIKNAGAGASPANIEIKSISNQEGTLTQNKAIGWNSVRQTLEVNVKSAGAYHIFTDKVAGVQFEASGIFEKAGTYEVDLIASGTPKTGGYLNFPIVQPAISETLKWIVTSNETSSNTNKFVYNLEPSEYIVKENEVITVSLKLIYGNAPANKEIKWFVNGLELKDGAFGTTGVISKTDTQIKIKHSGDSNAKVYVMVIDKDTQGTYYITSNIDLQWKSTWLWNISGSLFENKIVYWKIMGKNDFQKDPTPPSSCRCKKIYGPSAELSTMRELIATVPTDVTIGKVLSNVYSHKNVNLTASHGEIYYNIYTKNKMSEEILAVIPIGAKKVTIDLNIRGTRYKVDATNSNADFWFSITDQEDGFGSSSPVENLSTANLVYREWIDRMLAKERYFVGRIKGVKDNSAWYGQASGYYWAKGTDLELETQEITVFGCSVPVSIDSK